MHFLFVCPATKYVRKRHKIARESETLVESGGDMYETINNLLCTDIKGTAAWIEDTWLERKGILYT